MTDDAGESFEILYAQQRFREAGFNRRGRHGEEAAERRHSRFQPGWNTYIEKPGYLVASDVTFDEVNVDDYAAVLLIGGRAPEFLRHNAKVIRS